MDLTKLPITVLLPVYNGEKYLVQCIDSILSQTFEYFELLIIDDGSTDGSKAIIEKYNDKRIRKFYHKNMGVSYTLNEGVLLAKGTYIARIDQDDICFPDRLKIQLQTIRERKNAVLIFSGSELIDSEGNYLSYSYPYVDLKIIKYQILNKLGNPITHSTAFFNRDVIIKLGNYSLDTYKNHQDFELWYRILKNGYEMYGLKEALIKYRKIITSMSYTSALKNNKNLDMFFKYNLLSEAEKAELAIQIGVSNQIVNKAHYFALENRMHYYLKYVINENNSKHLICTIKNIYKKINISLTSCLKIKY